MVGETGRETGKHNTKRGEQKEAVKRAFSVRIGRISVVCQLGSRLFYRRRRADIRIKMWEKRCLRRKQHRDVTTEEKTKQKSKRIEENRTIK